jgi:hypothetical protein
MHFLMTGSEGTREEKSRLALGGRPWRQSSAHGHGQKLALCLFNKVKENRGRAESGCELHSASGYESEF